VELLRESGGLSKAAVEESAERQALASDSSASDGSALEISHTTLHGFLGFARRRVEQPSLWD
jgi:hypothetical protein